MYSCDFTSLHMKSTYVLAILLNLNKQFWLFFWRKWKIIVKSKIYSILICYNLAQGLLLFRSFINALLHSYNLRMQKINAICCSQIILSKIYVKLHSWSSDKKKNASDKIQQTLSLFRSNQSFPKHNLTGVLPTKFTRQWQVFN